MQTFAQITTTSTSHWHPRLEVWISFLFLCVFFVPGVSASSWENLTLTGDIPSARCDHSMVRIGDLYYLYGGRDIETNVKSITSTLR